MTIKFLSARTRSSFSKRLLFYMLAIGSAILTALFVIVDTYISLNIISDPYVFAQVSWISGSLIIIIIMIVSAIPVRGRALGNQLDPNFKAFHLPPWEVLKYVMLGGVFMGLSNLFYFQMVANFDASTFVPLMSFVIIYLLIGDFIMEKDNPTIIEIQAIIAIISGIFISSLSQGDFDLKSVIITIVFMNGLSAGVTISHKKATQWTDSKSRKPLDSITIRFYSVLVATFINTIVFIIKMDRAQLSYFRVQLAESFLFVTVSMLLASFAYIIYIRALKMGKMSIVNSLKSFSVIIAIPLTMIAHNLFPSNIPFDIGGTTGMILKIIGALLVLTGMISLALSDVKILAIVKVSEDGLKEIDNIAAMKGVTRVSVLAGKYDLLITIRTRSLGKGYRQTIRKIRAIPTIKLVNTIPILKEWN